MRDGSRGAGVASQMVEPLSGEGTACGKFCAQMKFTARKALFLQIFSDFEPKRSSHRNRYSVKGLPLEIEKCGHRMHKKATADGSAAISTVRRTDYRTPRHTGRKFSISGGPWPKEG